MRTCWRPVTSTLVLSVQGSLLYTYYRRNVEENNMLDTSDLSSFSLVFLLFFSFLFYYILFYFLWPGNAFYHDDLDSWSLSIQRSFLYSQCWKPKQAWGLWPPFSYSFYQEASYFVWIFFDQGILISSDLHSCSLSIQRSILFSPYWRPKQAWGLWPYFYQEIDPSTYFRWIVDDQNMLETSDLHSCPPSV